MGPVVTDVLHRLADRVGRLFVHPPLLRQTLQVKLPQQAPGRTLAQVALHGVMLDGRGAAVGDLGDERPVLRRYARARHGSTKGSGGVQKCRGMSVVM